MANWQFQNKQDILQDKIGLSSTLQVKIFNVINFFNNICRKKKMSGFEDVELMIDDDWHLCWQNIAELYDFLEFEYVDELMEALEKEAQMREGALRSRLVMRYQELVRFMQIMDNYKINGSSDNFGDLFLAQKYIRFITTNVGLHDTKTRKRKVRNILEPVGNLDWVDDYIEADKKWEEEKKKEEEAKKLEAKPEIKK